MGNYTINFRYIIPGTKRYESFTFCFANKDKKLLEELSKDVRFVEGLSGCIN
jgi:hypothetical protein